MLAQEVKHGLSTLALVIAVICFAVALLISTNHLHGGNTAALKDIGWISIIVALLLGSRP